ncbi:MAG TPA: ABC transporter substrate-binding protein, partial [Deltaproteobacteria bacterium]|nr:ABC transporter substrate-binding protein [Deltaproteobacteria bacterium]
LLVLGHFYSASAEIAGTLYKQRGIPAITASATSDSITYENDWYFSVLPSNRLISEFIANYIKSGLGYKSASLIYANDPHGLSLSESFIQHAQELNIQIKGQWSFDREDRKLNDRLSYITAQLRAMDDPGIIYCAAYPIEGVKILAGLKFPGTPYTIIGPDSFSTPIFIKELLAYPKERIIPGYHSDGVYTTIPFMASIDGQKTRRFREEYLKKYRQEPSWIAACYYDAIQVAVKAIENAEISGQDLPGDRRKVRDALQRFSDIKAAVNGVTGPIYFDENGNYPRSMNVGIYNRRTLSPAFIQYQHLSDIGEESALTHGLGDNIISIGGKMMTRTKIVYVGSQIIEVRDLNTDSNTYSVDFFIWFRFKGEFDDKQIHFPNATSRIRLDQPVYEDRSGNITVRAYRIKADFKSAFDYYRYPFDEQRLFIRFHHNFMTRKRLIYVPDSAGSPKNLMKNGLAEKIGHGLPGWHINDISVYQDIERFMRGEKQFEVAFSRFNTDIHVSREKSNYLLKIFIPMFTLLTVLYLAYYIPISELRLRVLLILSVPIGNAFYHIKFTSLYSGGLLDYAYWAIYALTGAALLATVVTHSLQKRQAIKPARFMTVAEKIAHPVLVLAFGCWLGYRYFS